MMYTLRMEFLKSQDGNDSTKSSYNYFEVSMITTLCS